MTGTRVVEKKIDKIVWHDANIEKLKGLFAQGLSGSQIAAYFPGATRNAIIGKLHRIGLRRGPLVHPPLPPKPKKQRKHPVIIKPPVPKPVVLSGPPVGSVTFNKLGSKTCRSVEGYTQQGGHLLPVYCSNSRVSETIPFCLYHCGIFYRKSSDAR